jgi:hypothetical protein
MTTITPTEKSAPAVAKKVPARQHGSPLDFLLTRSQQVAALLSMALYFQFFVYRTERLMDSYLVVCLVLLLLLSSRDVGLC